MKHIVIITIALLIILNACTNSTGREVITNSKNVHLENAEKQELRKLELKVKGMDCAGCAYGVKSQLEEKEGVIEAEIKFPEGTGTVIYDAKKISKEEIVEASTVYSVIIISDTELNSII